MSASYSPYITDCMIQDVLDRLPSAVVVIRRRRACRSRPYDWTGARKEAYARATRLTVSDVRRELDLNDIYGHSPEDEILAAIEAAAEPDGLPPGAVVEIEL